MDLLREVLSHNLKDLRKQKGFTQVELSIALNITPSTYNQWEKGSAWPGSANLEALASLYSVRATRFFQDPDLSENPKNRITISEIKKDLDALIDKINKT